LHPSTQFIRIGWPCVYRTNFSPADLLQDFVRNLGNNLVIERPHPFASHAQALALKQGLAGDGFLGDVLADHVGQFRLCHGAVDGAGAVLHGGDAVLLHTGLDAVGLDVEAVYLLGEVI